MRIEEKVRQTIVDDLRVLSAQIKLLLPSVICNVETATLHDSLQICASFLKTPQSDTIDLCVVFKQSDAGIEVSADLVRGNSGTVLSETHTILLPRQKVDEEFDKFFIHVKDYILSQESSIIQELNRDVN
jgi:hypothetical protein